ncbi:MAG: hypothetical protein K9M99_01420 [Candidatus Cloacimonetes bacterium]|nr:hypothetical protein [Candidatus Cloacimonadota bacterium]
MRNNLAIEEDERERKDLTDTIAVKMEQAIFCLSSSNDLNFKKLIFNFKGETL